MVDLTGRSFAAPQPFQVSEERLAAFATATGTSYAEGGPAPATFAIVPMFEALSQLIGDPEAGLDLSRIVHGSQKFSHDRPIVAGDVLTVALEVTGVRHTAGMDIISTATTMTTESGEHVCTAEATFVHRAAA